MWKEMQWGAKSAADKNDKTQKSADTRNTGKRFIITRDKKKDQRLLKKKTEKLFYL